MKYLGIGLIILFFAVSHLAATSLQEILSRQAQALGGLDKLKAVRSYIVTADLSVGGIQGHSVTYAALPHKYRVDLVLPVFGYSQACDGADCWMKDNQGNVQTLGADFKKMIVTQSAIDNWDYTDSAGFDGKVTLGDSIKSVDSIPCYVITIEPKGGAPALLYIDTTSFLLRQMAMRTDMGDIFSRLSDYRPVEGVLMPFRSTEMSDAGLVSAVSTVTDVKINVSLPDTLFAREASSARVNGLPEGADSAIVPFALAGNHAYIKVRVNASDTLNFIFDTGAGGIGINKRIAGNLGLERLGSTEARGVGGADSSAVLHIDSLDIGAIHLTDLSGFAVDFSPIEAAGTRKIDGIIGYDLLSRFVVTVNYEDTQLVLYRRDVAPRDYWGHQCSLTIDFRVPYTQAVINDSISGIYRLDTGSGSTIDFNSPFVQAHQLIGPDSSDYTAITSVGVGGGTQGKLGLLPSIKVCGSKIESLYVSYSSSSSGIFAGPNTAGNIGAGVLKRFAVTFDYGREAVYFQPRTDQTVWQRVHNMAGIGLKLANNEIVVDSVFAGRPSAGMLKPGDVLLSINGEEVKGKTVAQTNLLLIGRHGETVDVKVRRDKETTTAKITLDTLY